MAPRIDAGRLPRPFGPYQLLRRIAVGGMAEVYVALARGVSGFEKLVALKLIHPGFSEDEHFVRMLVDEAKLSVLLTHANIAQTFDLGSIEGRFFIVMEYVDGVDASKLLALLAKHGDRLPIEAALFIAIRVLHALDYAHRKTDHAGASLNVIHRDVSPQNVLLGLEGDVRLTDFGIAKAALRTSETEVGVIKGKYCYMSPEQAWADPIDQRSDIYSAGAVLYELLTGRMLVEPDENLPALLERVRRAQYVPATVIRPSIPAEVDAILRKALAAKADDRYETAGDFAADLEHALWKLDRTYNPSRLKALMEEHVPPATTGAQVELDDAGTLVTKIEGLHAKMNSREFMPETSASMLFTARGAVSTKPRDDGAARARSNGPETVRNLVESRTSRPSDPREEPAVVAKPAPDDEEEATTFFSREAFAEASAGEVPADGESTVIDASGDLKKRLDEMISLGGARAPKTEPRSEAEPEPKASAAARAISFRPPAPLWEPLPFVGPPLEAHEMPAPTPEPASALSRVPRIGIAAVVVVLLALVALALVAR